MFFSFLPVSECRFRTIKHILLFRRKRYQKRAPVFLDDITFFKRYGFLMRNLLIAFNERKNVHFI